MPWIAFGIGLIIGATIAIAVIAYFDLTWDDERDG